jgi:hypothetical protein
MVPKVFLNVLQYILSIYIELILGWFVVDSPLLYLLFEIMSIKVRHSLIHFHGFGTGGRSTCERLIHSFICLLALIRRCYHFPFSQNGQNHPFLDGGWLRGGMQCGIYQACCFL